MDSEAFQIFAEAVSEPLLLLTPSGKITVANAAARRLLAVSEADLGRVRLAELSADPAQRIGRYLRACATARRPLAGELRLRGDTLSCVGRTLTVHGETLVLLRCARIGAANEVSGAGDAVQQEVDRRRRVEAALDAARAHAKAVLDTVVDGVITIDSDGTVTAFNRAAERLFGYRADDILGANVRRLMPAPHAGRHDGYIRRYLATGEKRVVGIGREVEGRRADGSVFPMELAVSEVTVGGRRYFTGLARDISDRRRAEDEARQHRERLAHVSRLSTLGEMATGIAHEINQPLTAIATYARACHRLIETGQGQPEELLATLDKIANQAQRAGEVIRRLRGFIRKRDSRRERCDLNALVEDAVLLAETDARSSDFAILTRLAGFPLTVEADPIQVQQVLLNLLRNAMDAMAGVAASDEVVTVAVTTVAEDEQTAHVRVTDRGGGIAADHAGQLFSPFFSTKAEGLGMGLSISRSIINAHGGRLWFEPNPERGVTMHFTLPLATAG